MAEFETDIKNCLNALSASGAILYPTDTVWGLGCNALDGAAVNKIFAIKHRPKEKSLIILLAEAKDVLRYVATPHPDIIDIISQFERPTTVIYDNAVGFPDNVVHDDGSIAIRVTNDPFCKALIKRLQTPLVSTSANISGMPTPAIFSEVDTRVINATDYVVKYRMDDLEPRSSSRLVKINADGTLQVLRP